MSTPTDMDDYELFGGEPPSTPQRQQTRRYPTSPQDGGSEPEADPSRGTRSTLADTAAAVARRKKEADRSAIIHEILLIGGLLVVMAGGWYFWKSYSDNQERKERAAAELQAKIEKEKREEERAYAEKRAKEAEEKRLAAEAKRKQEVAEREAKRAADKAKQEEMARLNKAAQRFKELRAAFGSAEIDYYQNIGEGNGLGVAGTRHICLIPGGGLGYTLYEVCKTNDQMSIVQLTEKGETLPVTQEVFQGKLNDSPCLVFRDFGAAGMSTEKMAYVRAPGGKNTLGKKRPFPMPSAGSTFSPAREEFGSLYTVMRELRCSKLAYRYKVMFRSSNLREPVEIKTIGLSEELGHNAFREAVRKALESFGRARKVTDADVDAELRHSSARILVEVTR